MNAGPPPSIYESAHTPSISDRGPSPLPSTSSTLPPAHGLASTSQQQPKHASSSSAVSPSIDSTDHSTHIVQPMSLPTAVYHGSTRIKVRIDSNVPVQEIINPLELVASQQLRITEPAALFCLRDVATDVLVTDENLLRLLTSPGAAFKLVNSPVIEAAEMVDKLGTKNDKIVKLATFELKKFIQEPIFTNEFVSRGGLIELVSVIESYTGNTLAYALLSMQTLMEADTGWEDLDQDCLIKIINIFATESLINIARPATAILRKLVLADPAYAPAQTQAVHLKLYRETIWNYGFVKMWPLIQNEPAFWPTVERMLHMADQMTVIQVLGLVNALAQAAVDYQSSEFAVAFEASGTRQAILALCDTMAGNEEIVPLISQFQQLLVNLLHLLYTAPADPTTNPDLANTLSQATFHLFGSEDTGSEQPFHDTGLLGFSLLIRQIKTHSRDIQRLFNEQQRRSPERRCPFGPVSNAILQHLADMWNIADGSLPSGPSQLMPPLLDYPTVHFAGVKFFYRLWSESVATTDDFERINALVGTQLQTSLRLDSARSWSNIEQELSTIPYRHIRDRQMSELALEDELLSKAPIRNLRGRLYQESFSYIRNQRIQCLMEGAWFQHSVPTSASGGKEQRRAVSQSKSWRFYRLAANQKHLHFVETPQKISIRAGLEDLPERLDLSIITDIISSQTLAQANQPRAPLSSNSNKFPPLSPAMSKAYSNTFSLHSANGIIAELQAPDADTYSEWIDGLSLLKPNGYITTRETADLVQALTDIGVKIKLLDLTGEQVRIPTQAQIAALPASRNFHYADI